MRVVVFMVSEAVDTGELARRAYEITASALTVEEFLNNSTAVGRNAASILALVETSLFVGSELLKSGRIYVGWSLL